MFMLVFFVDLCFAFVIFDVDFLLFVMKFVDVVQSMEEFVRSN